MRILLKISGEALGKGDSALDPATLDRVASEIAEARKAGAELALVVGGGNIFRGLQGSASGMKSRCRADQMGMLATVINALALQDALEKQGVPVTVMSGLEVPRAVETFTEREARRRLSQGEVLIFAGGTGNPFFTTDTAAALRAAEIGADRLCKATKVDGIYDADPVKHPEARRFETITCEECLERHLAVMDQTAFSLCRENHIGIVVCALHEPGNIVRVARGESVGTLVSSEK